MTKYVHIETIAVNEYDKAEWYDFSNLWSAEYQEVCTPEYTRWQWVLLPEFDAGHTDRFYPDTWEELICMMQVEDNCVVVNPDGTPIDGKFSTKRTQEVHEYEWHVARSQRDVCFCDECRGRI